MDVTLEKAIENALKDSRTLSVSELEQKIISEIITKYQYEITQMMTMTRATYPAALIRGILIGMEASRTATVVDDIHLDYKNKLLASDPFGEEHES